MRANSNRKPQNNKMQRTKHGPDGASPLILVLNTASVSSASPLIRTAFVGLPREGTMRTSHIRTFSAGC